ncbi:prepilin peptidase [Convivina praedatoris]|uniref:Prepilin peptidase A24 N-terminal domain-containing protein n=1 Tax=Convivina praedatoris TaxID=2880963 RepID=A0ABN8HAV0_9LACO|nr:prepilin peptidase [Convivina sp. LMG 32447]CAH1856303.1 hypothetical protein R078138_01320 [Convivina sp. LMG 32447]CAH1856515.1 hypothetical protein R077815_01434 [Convivina sp. LMG 32447]CAH1856874.1 hypothetical protein LMG032447_01377 [Convivina sp. LMG 32447]
MQDILILCFSAILISTLLCLVDRSNQGVSLWTKRSYCFNCHHQLKALDLIPIISALLLQGRCRHCHFKFGLRFAIYEGIGAIILYHFWGQWLTFIICLALLFLTVEDLYQQQAHSNYLWLINLILYIQKYHHTSLYLLITISLLSWWLIAYRKVLGSGDYPVLILLLLDLTYIQFAWAMLLATGLAFLFFFKASHRPAIAFIPFLSVSWLVIKLFT